MQDEVAANMESVVRDLVKTVPLITDQINNILEKINTLTVTDATLKSTIELELKALRTVVQNVEKVLLYGDGGNESVANKLARFDERQQSNTQELKRLDEKIKLLDSAVNESLKKITITPEGVQIKGGVDWGDNQTRVVIAVLGLVGTAFATFFSSLVTDQQVNNVREDVKQEIQQNNDQNN